MGLDLTLLVLTHDTADWGFSHTLFALERTGIAGLLMESLLVTTSAPARFDTYTARTNGDPHYGDTQTDPYGDSIKCVTCEQLAPLAESPSVTKSDTNRAAWAYLGELNPSTRVALYYH